MQAIVSVKWLKDNLDAPEVIILNASIPKASEVPEAFLAERLIPDTRFFDIKNKFSAVLATFPNTCPSVAQFTQEAQTLGINKDSLIVVYDDNGIYSSARAWWLFKVFGHQNVVVLDGGLPEWKKFNYRTEPFHSYKGQKGDFIGLKNERLMKSFEDVRAETQDKWQIIIDARSEKRFNCMVDEPRIGLRRGTIPNSINLPFESLLKEFRLKNINRLKAIFNKVAKPSDALTFSCGSGITACILALGATVACYSNISVYDGSWTEYGTLSS